MTPEPNGSMDRRVGKLEYQMERIFKDLYHETGGLVGNFRDLVTILKDRERAEKEKKEETVEKKKIGISQNQVIIALLGLILTIVLAVTGWLISLRVNHASLFTKEGNTYDAGNTEQQTLEWRLPQ
jgi:hypothetical protein